MNFETDIVKRQSVIDMAAAYESTVEAVKQAHARLKQSEDRLKLAFGDRAGFRVQVACTEKVLKELKRDAWRAIFQMMEMPRMMSEKRRNELEAQIESGDLPNITAENVFATCKGLLENLDTYIDETVKETFDFLRPHWNTYKTNSEFEIGKKVIVRAFYPDKWGHRISLDYNHEQHYRNLDNVFSLMDGKGAIKTYGGPIIDAVKSMNQFGDVRETEYFRLKLYRNGNMHLEFRRMDLVKKLNEIAGGNRLRAKVA
ncbi:MAG: DUF4942 domain-containing protein [Smithella sp.]|jgi:hypothetical protein